MVVWKKYIRVSVIVVDGRIEIYCRNLVLFLELFIVWIWSQQLNFFYLGFSYVINWLNEVIQIESRIQYYKVRVKV